MNYLHSLPNDIVFSEIIPYMELFDIYNYHILCKITVSQVESVDFWKGYIKKQTHNTINNIALKLSFRRHLFLLKYYLVASKGVLDIVTLQQILITFAQFEFEEGIEYLLSFVESLDKPFIEYLTYNDIKIEESTNIIHPNFPLDATILVGVRLTSEVVSIIKEVGLDYQKFISNPGTRSTFRPKNSHYIKLIDIDKGTSDYSHAFYSRFGWFSKHLIPIIHQLRLEDYLWLFDSRTVLPTPMVHYDSCDEDKSHDDCWGGSGDSDYSDESEDEFENVVIRKSQDKYINDVPVRYIQYADTTMLDITESIAGALAAWDDKYINEMLQCLRLVKSSRLKAAYIRKMIVYCNYDTFKLLIENFNITLKDYFVWLDTNNKIYDIRVFRHLQDIFTEERYHFFKFQGFFLEPEEWVDGILNVVDRSKLKIYDDISYIHYRGYDVWSMKAIEYASGILGDKKEKKIKISTYQAPYPYKDAIINYKR